MLKITIIFIFFQFSHFVLSTDRPIVGILSQEVCFGFPEELKSSGSTYILASYVKAVEASGARVVPIFTNQNRSYYEHLLHSINGVVVPGGMAPLVAGGGYYDAMVFIQDIAKKMNDKGTYFPVLYICLGFEAVLIIENNHTNLLTDCDAKNMNMPLLFKSGYKKSLLFSRLSLNVEVYLKYFPVTKHFHRFCVTHENFTKYGLDENWLVTSDNFDNRGLRFISTIEHKKYPFIGTAFHPEKYFEWSRRSRSPHSRIGIAANRYFYDVFVDQAKKNINKFENEDEELDSLIANFTFVYSKHNKHNVDQFYVI